MVAGVSWDVHSPSAATNMSDLLGPLPSSPETGSVDCDPDPATTSYHDSEGLDLSAALVVRAAEFAATTEQSVCQNLAAWLGPPGSTGKRTIEVRTTTKSGDKHAALVRWLRAAAVPPFAQGRRVQTRSKPPAWRTVAEKKLNQYFDKSREPVKSWGAGDVRKWHLRPPLIDFLQELIREPSRIVFAINTAAMEREASDGLVLLSWPKNLAAPAAQIRGPGAIANRPSAAEGALARRPPLQFEPEPEPELEQKAVPTPANLYCLCVCSGGRGRFCTSPVVSWCMSLC